MTYNRDYDSTLWQLVYCYKYRLLMVMAVIVYTAFMLFSKYVDPTMQ